MSPTPAITDLSHLHAFLALAQELHFGRAAERLHMAQPALSRVIQRLEKQVGARLFERNTRSVELTAAGTALVPGARAVLAALHDAEAAVRATDQGEAGSVHVAFAGVSTYDLVARLARTVKTRRPAIQLELASQHFADPAMEMLVAGETDIALGRWDVTPEGVTSAEIMPDSLAMAVPDTHPLAGATAVSMADLVGDTFVSLPAVAGSILADRLRQLARRQGFLPDVVQVAPDTQAALALVGAEVGCHLTLLSVAHSVSVPHVSFVPVADSSPDVPLLAAWRTGQHRPVVEVVLSILFEVSAELTGEMFVITERT